VWHGLKNCAAEIKAQNRVRAVKRGLSSVPSAPDHEVEGKETTDPTLALSPEEREAVLHWIAAVVRHQLQRGVRDEWP
jgi:hypothetical protein